MTQVRFRRHRSTLEQSLQTTVMVGSLAELLQAINTDAIFPLTEQDVITLDAMPELSTRARKWGHWETHIVTVNGNAVGYTDGSFEEIT